MNVIVTDGFGHEHVFNNAKYRIDHCILHVDSTDGSEGASFAHWAHVKLVATPAGAAPEVVDVRRRRNPREPRHIAAVEQFILTHKPRNKAQAISDAYGVTMATAARWIKSARDAGANI